MTVPWRGLDTQSILKYGIMYELLYQGVKLMLKSSEHQKLRAHGNSYLCAFVNAVFTSYYGVTFLILLWSAPEESKALSGVDSAEPFFAETNGVRDAALPFIAWIVFDLIHVVTNFPELGSYDQLFHHAMFIILTCVSTGFGVCPFAGCWLFCGELSSLPLNIRWYVINSGQGATVWMTLTNIIFCVTFFTVRVLLYWFGLYGFLFETAPILKNNGAPGFGVNIIAALLSAGAILNVYWFLLIVKMATGLGKKAKKAKDSETKRAGALEVSAVAGATSTSKPKAA